MELPSNFLFELARRGVNLVVSYEDIFGITKEPSSSYIRLKKTHYLRKQDTISNLEKLYETKYSSHIKAWKEEKIKEILGKGNLSRFDEEELELRRFIVYNVIPNFGVYPTFREERRKVEKEKEGEKSIWKRMLDYRDYDLDVFALLNIGGPRIYKLEESSIGEDQIHVSIDGVKYCFLEFENSFEEMSKEYDKAIRRFFFSQVLEEVRKSPKSEFEALGKAIEEFNAMHEKLRRGIIRESSKSYKIYAETPEKYALYCGLCSEEDKKPVYHVFGKGRIEIRVRSDLTYTMPRMSKPYKHPHVWEESGNLEICFGDFGVDYLIKTGQIPANDSDLKVRGLHIALWLINGVRGLVTSTISHGTYITHEEFKKFSFEEISKERIPITNVKRKVVLSV